MTRRYWLEGLVLCSISGLLYWMGFELQSWLFKFSEHIAGVNWFYLPSGLRVTLVWVAGLFGAVGIAIATLFINLAYFPDLTGLSLLLTSLASGFGAWLARLWLRQRGVLADDMRLSPDGLMLFALVFAVINALLHQTSWWLTGRAMSAFWVDLWPMFIGDLLGAIAFLYGFKVALVVFSRVARGMRR